VFAKDGRHYEHIQHESIARVMKIYEPKSGCEWGVAEMNMNYSRDGTEGDGILTRSHL
jgi:hypothetical protein